MHELFVIKYIRSCDKDLQTLKRKIFHTHTKKKDSLFIFIFLSNILKKKKIKGIHM
jgi:hypothetical protein